MLIQLSNLLNDKKLNHIYFLSALMLTLSNPIYAAAPTINGAVDITIKTGTITNVALGMNSIAQVGIGSVSDGDGTLNSFKTDITAGNIINRAEGAGSCAQVLIGTVGFPNCGGGQAAE